MMIHYIFTVYWSLWFVSVNVAVLCLYRLTGRYSSDWWLISELLLFKHYGALDTLIPAVMHNILPRRHIQASSQNQYNFRATSHLSMYIKSFCLVLLFSPFWVLFSFIQPKVFYFWPLNHQGSSSSQMGSSEQLLMREERAFTPSALISPLSHQSRVEKCRFYESKALFSNLWANAAG